ncbi:MAG TPA: hypothetical protein VFP65_20880 [Anaeromyxobacteraceae bacterium]|nr:hypothetical protein [Anaeromyxobacteraceae bacterium]
MSPGPANGRVVEVRVLTLKEGGCAEFERLFTERSLPLLRRWGFDVVSYGPSRHDEVTFYVIRAFASLEERQRLEDAFYGSDDWRQGPREAMLALIERWADAVLDLDVAAVEGLRGAR